MSQSGREFSEKVIIMAAQTESVRINPENWGLFGFFKIWATHSIIHVPVSISYSPNKDIQVDVNSA